MNAMVSTEKLQLNEKTILSKVVHVHTQGVANIIINLQRGSYIREGDSQTARNQSVFPMSIIWLQTSQVSEANLIPPDQTPSVTQKM